MFSLKKRSESKGRWHADFRLVDRLPDTKIIRTKFIINFFFVGTFLMLLSLGVYREVNKVGLRQSIASLESEVEARSVQSKHLAKFNGDFRKLANKMDDIEKFKESPIPPSWLLVELSRIRTPDVVFDVIEYDDAWNKEAKAEIYHLKLAGQGRTTADIGELKNRLAILEISEGWQIDVSEEGNPSKDVKTGIFSFVILVEISKVKNGN